MSTRNRSSLDRRHSRNRFVILLMAALLVLSLFGTALVGLFSGNDDPPPDDQVAEDLEPDPTAPTAEPCPPDTDAPPVDAEVYDEPPLADLDADADYVVTLDTTCGDVVIELDTDGAPIATANLVGLAEDGYYDGVMFHRVAPGFIIQVGDPAGTGCGQEECPPDPDEPTYPGYQFEDELDRAEELFAQVRDEFVEVVTEEFGDDLDDVDLDQVPGGYPRGTVAMANAGPDTNGSQFFVAQGEPTLLGEPAFTVLGEVVEGMDVVDRIAGQELEEVGPDNYRPVSPIRIVEVVVEQR